MENDKKGVNNEFELRRLIVCLDWTNFLGDYALTLASWID